MKTVLGGSKTTDYCGNVIYENGLLKRILVDGGYIENDIYYFCLTDHLGNNRVIASANGSIVQSNHYYPFGMSFAEGSATSQQPYKYNGKELDTERGLNLYDYSARYMDPALGRFNMVDPMAEKYYSISPYVYVDNNPMKYIDPTGMLFSDPPGNYFQNLWSYYKEVYKSVSVTFSAGLQAGASAKISNKEVGAHLNVISSELEVLNNGEFSANNTSVTQGVDINVGVAGFSVTNEIKDNNNGTATKTETCKAHAAIFGAEAKTTSEHIENKNGTYTEVSKKTEVFVSDATLSVNAQVFVGAEVTVDISKIWKAFKDLIKNTFNPD
ncbi:RHS repeat domain-containing protein [Bacteroides graminisolvens]|uniref:RHS repeat domain-containing protein n=1 Tax=Bacteroides graminisolvens TaxID=477666 RepID=UPI00240946E4|nr:RHS repeat-associated core domain-containing protein [Bacteroides graminisolvens]